MGIKDAGVGIRRGYARGGDCRQYQEENNKQENTVRSKMCGHTAYLTFATAGNKPWLDPNAKNDA
jgi:hypothetical protein